MIARSEALVADNSI